MSYSDSFPSVSPVFQANFAANGGKIDPRASFSRASTASVWDGSKHLSSENLATNSNNLSDWGLLDITRTLSQVGPDGSSNAAKLTGVVGTVFKAIYKTTLANTSAQTISFFAKEDTHRYIQVSVNGDATKYVNFDLNGSGAYSANGAGVTASITASGNGYLRCAVNLTLPSTSAYISLQDSLSAAREATTASTGSIYIFGAMATTLGDATNVAAYVAAGSQIHREYAPTLVSKANNVGRFDHTTDGQSMGCLIEGQSTNLATYGSDLTNAAWNPLSAFIGGTAVGPDGTLSAVKLVASAGSGLAPRFRRLSLLTDTTQTFSIYVKPLEFQHLAISADGSTACMVLYNLSGSGAITSATGATGAVEQCGNGWFRVSFSYTTTPSLHLAITMQSSTTYQTETGNGYDGMLFALAQLETGQMSSFIGTTSSTVTRAAESLSVATADIGYTGGPVSLFCDGTAQGENTGGGQVLFAVRKDDANRIGVWTRRTNKRIALVSGGGVSSSLEESSWYDGKTALSLTTDNLSGSINGRTVLTDTSQPLPDLNGATVYVGNLDSGTAYQMNGHVKRVALYGEALSDTNLQALTS